MRIVSASRRTDIPAFYSRWFMNRVRAGYCHWLNPYSGQVYRVSLLPEDVLAVVFWTRNPGPLLPHFEELRERGLHFYLHLTVNGYPRTIESHNPPLEVQVTSFERAAAFVGPELIQWRYDPIMLSDATPPEYHLERFGQVCERLSGLTQRCYFSFVDFYGKTSRNLQRLARQEGITAREAGAEERRTLVHGLRDIAAGHDITLYACCEADLVGEGIAASHCIDIDIVRMLREDADIHLASAPTRAECGCVETSDIGAYDTCVFGCSYCYATNTRAAAQNRLRDHNSEDSMLWRPQTLRSVDLSTREFRPKSKATIATFLDMPTVLLPASDH